MTSPQPQHLMEGLLDILKEAIEGGAPGEGTAFLNGTKKDGSGNSGLRATLDSLSAGRASRDIHARTKTPDGDLSSGLTGVVAHAAYHLGAIRQMLKEV